jgi:hypothetical protein
MDILQHFLEDPDDRREAFLDDVRCWALGTLHHLRLRGDDPGTASPLPVDLQYKVACMTVGHLDRQLGADHQQGFLKVLREKFADPEDPTDQDNALKTYLTALICYCLAEMLTEDREREQALGWMAAALGRPIEAIARRKAYRVRGLEPAAADAAAGQLTQKWMDTPCASFEVAVGQAQKEAATQSKILVTDRRTRERALAVVKRHPGFPWQHDPELERKCIEGELLEAIYPLACRVVRRLRNKSGEQFFPWLILGGVAHTARCALRGVNAPHLVQPDLIAAFKGEFGANFIRNKYARPVSGLFDDEEEGYWELARQRLLELLGLQLLESQVRYWTHFIGEDSRTGIAAVSRRCQEQAQGSDGAAGSMEEEFPPPGLGWGLFLETGEYTYRLLSEGKLPGAAHIESKLAGEKKAEQSARCWLQRPLPQAESSGCEGVPPREWVAGVAAYFSRNTKTKEGWKKRIRAFAGGVP